MSLSKVIRISQSIFERLQKLAVPLEDTPADVIERLLDFYDANQKQETSTWKKEIVDTGEISFGGVSVGDINNDGLLDIVSRYFNAGHVFWYEAPDWEQQIIDENIGMARHTCLAEMDGDDDLDVVASSWGGEVAWYKAPNWEKSYVDTSLRGSAGLCVADLNADVTLDIISTGVMVHSVVWYDLATGIDIVDHKLPLNLVRRLWREKLLKVGKRLQQPDYL